MLDICSEGCSNFFPYFSPTFAPQPFSNFSSNLLQISLRVCSPTLLDIGLNLARFFFLFFLPCRIAQVVDRALGEEAVRSRQESVQMVERWNSGTQDYPDRSCLHDMFRESAKKNRDATAILYKVRSDRLQIINRSLRIINRSST